MRMEDFVSPKEIDKKGTLKTIVIFSHNLDFSYSLFMFFQDKYEVTLTTNKELLIDLVRSSEIDLLIADTSPSEKVEELFRSIKQYSSNLPIILLYVYRIESQRLEKNIKKYVDAVFYKPIDLEEVTRRINELVMRG